MLFVTAVAVALLLGYLSQQDLRLLSATTTAAPAGADVVKFYDAVGGILMNDLYHNTFEVAAMKEMLQRCDMASAHNVLEIGPGSGFLAQLMLDANPHIHYTGVDLSSTLHAKASDRLVNYREAGRVELKLVTDSFAALRDADAAVDRFVFTYVLDLLPAEDIAQFAKILQSKLASNPNAKVCIANLTYGYTPLSRIVTNIWQLLYHSLGGAMVGGCRPFQIGDYFQPEGGFTVEYVSRVVSAGLPSEVAILSAAK